MKFDFELTGDRKIDKMFTELPKRLQNKILRQELKAAAKPMHALAKQLAPEDEGTLKRSIKVRAMKRKRNFQGRSILVDPKFFADQADGMRKFVAGLFMEYGTKYIDDSNQYMRPAFDAKKDQVLNTSKKNIAQRIEQEAKGLGT